jgi:HTH-type transcriptional regulator / antitoxin HigA
MDDHTYIGDVPHPGFYIREELEAREWTQRDLAYVLGTPEQAVNLIVSGKRGVSADMAKALGEAFDVNPELFANLQRAFDMARAREPNPSVGRRARLQSVYPVREMIKRGWLQDTDAAMLEVQMARFFEAASSNDIPHMRHAAKKVNYEETPPAQLAWLFRVRQIANGLTVPKYSEKSLRDAIARLRTFLIDPEEARNAPRILAECGVRLIIVECLPNAKIDGVCFWLDRHSPVIGLSLRFDRIDSFWFVLRHEIEHVLRRDGQAKEIIDIDIDAEHTASHHLSAEELAANAEAAEFCVPKTELDLFVARKAPFFSERDVIGFARRLGVHPGLIVGQIQKRTQRWDLLRRHLVKIRALVLPSAIFDGWGAVAPIGS